MAAIYTKNAEQLTDGLQGSRKCNEAIRAAVQMAADRSEDVMLDDDDGRWTVHPDGTVDAGWDGDWDEDDG